MATYLSFDLDFFNFKIDAYPAGDIATPLDTRHIRFLRAIETTLEQIGQFVQRQQIPCVAVMNHQQMLPFVDRSGCDTLLNVDTHSDLAHRSIDEFSCGSWVSYVKWRKTGKYIWLHGYRAGNGECAGGDKALFRPCPVGRRSELADWGRVEHRLTRQFPELTPSIKSIGVCLSPSYVHAAEDAQRVLRKWAKKYAIEYVRGRWNEHFCTRRLPPKAK